MLQSYVHIKNYVSIYDINERISHFKYSQSESKCKPSKILSNSLHEDGNLHQTGTVQWIKVSVLMLSIMYSYADVVPGSLFTITYW